MTAISCTPACDNTQRVVGGLYSCAKSGWNQQCSFEDIRAPVLAYASLCLKMHIHAHFGGILGFKRGQNGNFCSFICMGMQ